MGDPPRPPFLTRPGAPPPSSCLHVCAALQCSSVDLITCLPGNSPLDCISARPPPLDPLHRTPPSGSSALTWRGRSIQLLARATTTWIQPGVKSLVHGCYQSNPSRARHHDILGLGGTGNDQCCHHAEHGLTPGKLCGRPNHEVTSARRSGNLWWRALIKEVTLKIRG